MINPEKSSLFSEVTNNYIGYKVTTGKTNYVQCQVKACMLARIAGQCVSMAKAMLPAKLLINTYRVLASKTSWGDVLTMDKDTKANLEWWLHALKSWNGAPIQTGPLDFQMEADASMSGWGGGRVKVISIDKRAAGFWNHRLSEMPSNYHELMAVLMALKSFNLPPGNKLQVLTYNVTTGAYINHLGAKSGPRTASHISVDGGPRQGHVKCTLSARDIKCDSRHAVSPFRPLRMAAQPWPICVFGLKCGTRTQ